MTPRCLAAVCLVLTGTAQLSAQRSPLPPEQTSRVRSALDAVYRLDFPAAEERCRAMIGAWPSNPVGYVYLARVYWQELLVEERALTVHRFIQPDFFVEKPPSRIAAERAAVERFQKASRAAIDAAEAAIRKQPNDPATLYLLGAAYQNEALFLLALKRDWWQAFRAGSRSERAHSQLLRLDRNYSDALLVTGLLHYTVGALPWNIRWVPVLLGYSGGKQTGEKEMEQAAARGQLVADDARALLAVLYAIDKRFDQSLIRLEELRARYPENYLTQLDIAGIHLRQGDPKTAIAMYRDVIAGFDRKRRGGSSFERAAVSCQLGIAYRKANSFGESERWLRAAVDDPKGSARTRSQAILELAKTLDVAGRREEARELYHRALQAPGSPESHSEASRYLKRPYQER